MKFQYLLGFAPMFVQGLYNRALHIENVANALNNMVIRGTRVTSIRQECELAEYEDVQDCRSELIDAIIEIIKGLSDEEIDQFNEIIGNDELSLEQKAEELTGLLGEPGLCTPEFLEVLPRQVFCKLDCEEGFCEANEVEVAEALTETAGQFGCELVLDDVCEVFNEVTGDAVSFSAVGLGGVITLINIMVNGILN
eukprot:snap_masked-scaffold_22-processed-gene-3.29-mRNA-1 protein AED:1.00 eAED:1.00 QI:0/-1/0/0/-1/1/1/0/195